jgi:uncharacterized membrane protein YedE/YeeE
MHADNLHFVVENAAAILSAGGFVIGFIFGAIVIATNFCTMGAVADIVLMGDYRRFRSWVLAAAVALIGTQALASAGLLHPEQSIYLRGGLRWFGSIVGGLIFGFGMVLAGGCPSRNIARAGAGDLRAATTLLVFALFAHMAMGGLFGPARLWMESVTVVAMPGGMPPSLADITARLAGISHTDAARVTLASVIGIAALLYCFLSAPFRTSPRHMLAGVAIGICTVAGWLVTTLAQDDFAFGNSMPVSLSFVRPVAETFSYLARFTGMIALEFGVALVIGSVAGAMIVALLTRRFRLEGFADSADTGRNLAGAALMGVGGVMALGCSIGQGVAGISTLAVDSFLAFAAMTIGAVTGIRFLAIRA